MRTPVRCLSNATGATNLSKITYQTSTASELAWLIYGDCYNAHYVDCQSNDWTPLNCIRI